ncbi:MAG TPA: hypothetical protein DDW85_07415 [Porphyromonadaceae bacterium]|nr:hypothetical protein [Porphyromonadaceae bacterium]
MIQETKKRLWTKDFVLLTSANLLMAIAFYFMTPVMPLFMADRFQSDTAEIGMIMFTFAVAAIIMRPFSGFLLDFLNRYVVYLIAFVFFMLLFLGYALAATVTLMLVLRFLHGLTWGTMNTAAYTMAVDLTPAKRRGEGLGFFGLSMNVAMAVAPMLALAIIHRSGYNILFYSAVLFCFVALLCAFLVRVPQLSRTASVKFSFSGLFEKSALPIALIALLTQVSYGGILSFIALYGREIGVESSGLFFLLLSVGLAIARILSGRLFDKIGPAKVSFFGLILLVFGLVLVGYAPTSIGFHCAAFVLGIGFGVLAPAFQAMANNHVVPERRGAANSTYLMFFDSGIGIGMLLFGQLIDRIGYAGTFYVSAVITLVALIVFFSYTLPNYLKTKESF